VASRKKAYVRVHAQVRPDDRFHILGPLESGRIDHPFDPAITRANDFKPDAADFTGFGAFQCLKQRILNAHM